MDFEAMAFLVTNTGGMGLFSWLVYQQVRRSADAQEETQKTLARLQEQQASTARTLEAITVHQSALAVTLAKVAAMLVSSRSSREAPSSGG